MDALKAIASILICIVLLAAEIITMGLFSLNRALSQETMQQTMMDTELAGQLVDEALSQSAIGADSQYGEAIRAVLETDAMTGFFGGYLSSAVEAQISGEAVEGIGEAELLGAFSQGIDEVNDTGLYSISGTEKEALMQAAQAEAPGLLQAVEDQAGTYETMAQELTEETLGEELGLLYDLQKFMDSKTRMTALGGCLLLAILLILLNWRSRYGFFWNGAVTALASLLFWGMYLIGAERIISYMLHSSYLQDAALSMITSGLRDAAICGSILTLALFILFAVFKIKDRRRYE